MIDSSTENSKAGILCEPDVSSLADPNSGRSREMFARLARTLLVKLNLDRNGDATGILCGSRDMGCKGMSLMLPCRLDLKPGQSLDMELYLPSTGEPAVVHSEVRRVIRETRGDSVRYRVEVVFVRLGRATQKEISDFVHESRLQERRQLPA